MRMTNKIMQNNSLYNINNNKVLQDKLSTQMSTQKKLTRPSDDPVVAIRALRLRTSVSEISQFYEKNAPDAESWLKVTEEALGTGAAVITDLVKQATKGANKDLTPEDLDILLTQMKNLRDEYYSTGNVDYAGRYVFTGYRTDTTLSFTEEIEDQDPQPVYSITEQVTIGKFDSINYTNSTVLDGISQNNYTQGAYNDIVEQNISNGDIYRIRLAYDKLSDAVPTFTDANGNALVTVSKATKDPYIQMAEANADGLNVAIYSPETGEILLSNKAYEGLETVVAKEQEIRITYSKDSWVNGDLRPEHYFACTATTQKAGETVTVDYNQEYLNGKEESQIIEYDVGYNQSIRVNTTAREAFTHDLDRDIDDMEVLMTSLSEITAIKEQLEKVKEETSEDDKDKYGLITRQLDAANKAYDYVRESVHALFEKTITRMQGHLNDANIAVTDNGTRSSRLELISNRLMEQKTTFRTLQSENEDVDITEVAIQLTSTELTYEAALMATGKIMQTSLMNYI